MKSRIACITIIALAFSLFGNCLAQTPAGAGQDEERVVVSSNEIMLDAVVKDKKGRPVKDLQASDFEIFEDGAPQKIKSFRLITREANDSANKAQNGET